MPAYLNEDQVGTDQTVIAYPHLLLCMGLTVQMDDGVLIGGHYTSSSTEEKVSDKIVNLIDVHGGNPTRMYLTGNFYEHVQKHGGRDYTGKAALIGYAGDVFCFDTRSIKPKDGTFVRLTSLGVDAGCHVEYKREERVVYTDINDRVGSSLQKNPKKLQTVNTYQIKSVDTVSGTPLHVVKSWTFQAQV